MARKLDLPSPETAIDNNQRRNELLNRTFVVQLGFHGVERGLFQQMAS